MKSSQLFALPLASVGGLRGEIALRYAAAMAVTLIALAAAQLVLPTWFVLWLAAVTLVGVPFSLWLRARDGRLAGVGVPRPLWNAATVLGAGTASAYLLRSPLQHVWGALTSGNSEAILQMEQTEPMILLVQLFLIFAAFRSWTLLSDKDATLATVPSFSVLLLLIPVHRSVEVVCYFLLWTVAATVLFALEHRSEMRALVVAVVPAPAPGQEVRLAARSLAGVLGISLVAAVGLSGFLTARDPSEGAASESAVAQMASRWTQWGMAWMNGGSIASGPERQIDFSSRTSLPTRAVLWAANARTIEGKNIYPVYWRLFSLSNYNGSTWSQDNETRQNVKRVALSPAQWPFREFRRREEAENRAGEERMGRARDAARHTFSLGRPDGERRLNEGFPLGSARPELLNRFGTPREQVFYTLRAVRPNLGFIPHLPVPWSVVLWGNEQSNVQLRSDGSLDVNLTNVGQIISTFARVPMTSDNGFLGANPPRKKRAPGAQSPRLSAAERALNLKLPKDVPPRVRDLAKDVASQAAPDANNFARAQLLALATQRDAIYTLRPPTVPPEREAADFFLFESRRGYCTYFAGTLTVLCRSAGIPARMVSGFVAPEPEAGGDGVLLRDANAHSWTEVWVENWGWATVDATPAADRGDNAPTFLENWGDLSASYFDALLRRARAGWLWLVVGGGLLSLVLVVWRFRHRLKPLLGRRASDTSEAQRREIALAYRAATRELGRRFRPRDSWETPDEWLRAAQLELPNLPQQPLQQLTDLYVRAHFSPRQLEPGAAQKAREFSQSVRWPKRREFKRA